MEARAVARLAIGVDGAAVPHGLQRIDASRDHVAASLAVQRDDQDRRREESSPSAGL